MVYIFNLSAIMQSSIIPKLQLFTSIFTNIFAMDQYVEYVTLMNSEWLTGNRAYPLNRYVYPIIV